MIVRLNGFMAVNNDEYFFEDLEIEIDEDEINCDIEEYIMGCDECDFCDCFDNEEDEEELFNFTDSLDMLLDDYTELFMESCLCPECTKDLLLEFLDEFVDL